MIESSSGRLRRVKHLQRRLQALQPPQLPSPPSLHFAIHGTTQTLSWHPHPVGTYFKLKPAPSTQPPTTCYSLLPHQAAFITDRSTAELALVGGFGSGKSRALVLRSILLAAEQPGAIGLVIAPTHRMASDVLLPIFHDTLAALKLPYKAFKHPLPAFHLPAFNSQILIRSGDSPDRLRGMSVHFACVDELDVIAADHARNLWAIASSRVREGTFPNLFTSTTPEGFGFAYGNWVEQAADHKHLIRARTTDNPYLPDSYIAALRSIYPAEALEAYLDGQFVALDRGRCYPHFDRILNRSSAVIHPDERLHIGIDFNIGKMSAVICVRRPDQQLHAVAEDCGAHDTDQLIQRLIARYPDHHRERLIVLHPDASSASRSTNSSQTDMSKLRQAGFRVDAPSKNPLIRDSLNVTNAAILDGHGTRRLFVSHSCSTLLKSLEQQCYVNGQPDKASGLDHAADALRYVTWQLRNFTVADSGPVRGLRIY